MSKILVDTIDTRSGTTTLTLGFIQFLTTVTFLRMASGDVQVILQVLVWMCTIKLTLV